MEISLNMTQTVCLGVLVFLLGQSLPPPLSETEEKRHTSKST